MRARHYDDVDIDEANHIYFNGYGVALTRNDLIYITF